MAARVAAGVAVGMEAEVSLQRHGEEVSADPAGPLAVGGPSLQRKSEESGGHHIWQSAFK